MNNSKIMTRRVTSPHPTLPSLLAVMSTSLKLTTPLKRMNQTLDSIHRYFAGRNGTGVNALAKHSVLRPTAMTVMVTTLTMVFAPAVHAMQTESRIEAQKNAGGAASRYTELVRELKDGHTFLRRDGVPYSAQKAALSNAGQGVIGRATDVLSSGLKSLGLSTGQGTYSESIEQLVREHEALTRDNDALINRWKTAGVAPEIINQQIELDATVAAKHRTLIDTLKAANEASRTTSGATEPAAQKALVDFLKKEIAEPTHHKLNLKNLPWQSHYADLKTMRPPMSEAATYKRFLADNETKLQQTRSALTQKKGVILEGAKQATLDTLKTLPVSTNPTAADLAATSDAPHTAEIKALAATLNYQPVKIYQWVHDNIAYFPSYGSVQGAQDTLDKKSGNAFDQASLTIALLRASGIPARYVVGTIEVPEAKLRNWMGDFKDSDAAQQILGQGGIANVALVSGGRVATIRMEHAWVETYVNYYPGRGATHTGNPSNPARATQGTRGDSWIPIDPSYKQHSFKAALDLKTSTPFDAQGFIDAAKVGATINEAEGSVQNLNQANIKAKLDQYQQAIKTTIDQKPNATVGDVLGTQTILPDTEPYLAGSLPNKVTAIGERYSTLPESLRAQFRYGLYLDQFSYNNESPDFLYQAATSELAGKKITIAWVPATANDKAAIEALLPKPNADGSPIRPEQLPQGLPGSISLKAELRVEGVTKATSSAYRVGSEPIGAGAFTRYGTASDWDETTDPLIAGQQSALGISVQGISKQQLDTLKARMEVTKGKLEQVQAAPSNLRTLDGVTGELIASDVLTAGIWSYFMDLQIHGRLLSEVAVINTQNGSNQTTNGRTKSGMFDRQTLQYGLFHANAQPNKLFGAVTTGVSFRGVLMDIGHQRHMRWVKDQSLPLGAPSNADASLEVKKRWVSYNRIRAEYSSSLESTIPERFFNDVTVCNLPNSSVSSVPPYDAAKPACAEGVSAAKALAIGQTQGQKIFTINSVNAALAIPQLVQRGSVIDEIKASIAAGKEVTIHQSAISINGWSGAGYAVIDPETGTGSYLIEGGARGGFFKGLRESTLGSIGYDKVGEALLGLAPVFALIENGIIDGLVAYIQNPKSCLLDSQRSALLTALAQLDFLGKWYVPLPGITTSVAIMCGLFVVLSYTVHFTMLNAALDECPAVP